MISVYIASKYDNSYRVIELMKFLEAYGENQVIKVNCHWWKIDKLTESYDEKYSIIGAAEAHAVRAADVFIYVADIPSRGAHVEFGIAIGSLKPIIIYDEGGEFREEFKIVPFFNDRLVKTCNDKEDVLQRVLQINEFKEKVRASVNGQYEFAGDPPSAADREREVKMVMTRVAHLDHKEFIEQNGDFLVDILRKSLLEPEPETGEHGIVYYSCKACGCVWIRWADGNYTKSDLFNSCSKCDNNPDFESYLEKMEQDEDGMLGEPANENTIDLVKVLRDAGSFTDNDSDNEDEIEEGGGDVDSD